MMVSSLFVLMFSVEKIRKQTDDKDENSAMDSESGNCSKLLHLYSITHEKRTNSSRDVSI